MWLKRISDLRLLLVHSQTCWYIFSKQQHVYYSSRWLLEENWMPQPSLQFSTSRLWSLYHSCDFDGLWDDNATLIFQSLSNTISVDIGKEFNIYCQCLISVKRLLFCSIQHDSECLVRTAGEYWVVCKKSDSRELYVVICDRNANLTEINGKCPLVWPFIFLVAPIYCAVMHMNALISWCWGLGDEVCMY